MKKTLSALALGALLLAPSIVLAHPGHGGLSDGFLHPFTGIDHLMTLLALGVSASALRPRAAMLAVAAFLSAFLAGFLAARGGVVLPAQEPMLALSLLGMGAIAWRGERVFLPTALAVIAVFASYHGAAHGAEVDADAFGAALPGFFAACLVLTGGSFALGRLIASRSRSAALHYGHAMAALSVTAGVLLLGAL